MKPLAVFLVLASLALAQAPKQRRSAAAKTASGPSAIAAIQVNGNKRFSPAEVVALAGIKAGDPAVNSTFERARDRILATGCIETFAWRYAPDVQGRMTATLDIAEVDQFLPWTIDRLPVTPAEFAERASKVLPCFGREIPTTDRYFDQATRVMAAILKEKGVTDPVTAKVNLLGKDIITVVFQPVTPAPNIADVRFTNVTAIREADLRKQITPTARGVPYSELLFRQMLDNEIKPMYENIGRLMVRFPKVSMASSKEVSGVVVTAEVEEGPEFTLEDVEINGTPLSPTEIEDLAQYKRGETVNYTKVGLTLEKVLAKMKNLGYIKSSYKAKREINPEAKTAKLFVDVDLGPRYTMGSLKIEGLDVVSEPVIRKMWTMNQGDAFRADYPDLFLRTVRERGVFDFLGETQSKTDVNDQRRTIDVTLVFKGGKQMLDSRQLEKRP